ncbi:MAG: 3-deoxy-D-manno-octulosonic acid kinase [Xanthomonadales bacterium]|jgi:3-deoxy-D-manno-octulosonic acid kinase|nr:3-deoxy-D-manno-octulosonic acid kinase [Xanthomonadales bacterium]
MFDWRVIGPGIRREQDGASVMLYEPLSADNFSAFWFEPAWWAARGAIRGAAHGRGTTLFFEDGGRRYALRHYRRGGLMARLSADRYLFRRELSTRPVREFLLLIHLHAIGLPVPAPIGARVVRDGLFYRGDLITGMIPGTQTLAERLSTGTLQVADWIAVGRLVAQFHHKHVFHADLNAHNILVDDAQRWWLIDFDRGDLREPGLWCDSNLVRLRRSVLKICDALPAGRFNETLWTALLAGYRDVKMRADAAAAPTQR